MKQILIAIILVSLHLGAVPAHAATYPALSDHDRKAAIALAERIDLTRPGMEAMTTAIAAQDHRAVLNIFRARVVKRLRNMDFSQPYREAIRWAPFFAADAEMLMGRMTPNEYQALFNRVWHDDFSRFGPEAFPILRASGLMAPRGTPIKWLGPDGTSERVGSYIGAWGGGGSGFNTALTYAWWFSGKDEYRDKWLEISEGYFHEFFTAKNRVALKGGGFFALHTAWRVNATFIPSLALIAKHPDHSSKPAINAGWLTSWATPEMQQDRRKAQAPVSGDISAAQIEVIPAAALARIAIGLTDEVAPYLIDQYVTSGYFFVNQNYEGVLALATIATVFGDLKKSREIDTSVNVAFPDWANRSIFRDGGVLEQDFGYSLGYAIEFDHLVDNFTNNGPQATWLNDLSNLSARAINFWDQIQTPQGLLPLVGNSKYGSMAPRVFGSKTSTYFPYSGYAGLRTPGAPQDQLFMMFANSRRSEGHSSPNTGSIHVTAYGRDLIVPGGSPSYGLSKKGSVEKLEEKAFDNYAGEHSTFKNSTVMVNGLPQSRFYRGRFHDWLVAASDDTVEARWLSNTTFDYVESRWIGYELRGNNSHLAPVTEYNRDIEHHRQVVFIKPTGLWLLVDLMKYNPYVTNLEDGREGNTGHLLRSAVETTSPYTFTQIWNFAPPRNEARGHYGFGNSQVVVDGAGKRVHTNDPSGANLELFHFTGTPLSYNKFYGHKDESQYLGWLVDGKGITGTPRVDLHTKWQQSREDLIAGRVLPLATVIAPSRNTESVITSKVARVEQNGLVAGCELTTKDNHKVTFLSSAAPAQLTAGDLVAKAELLVLVNIPGENSKQGIILGCTELRLNGKVLSSPPHSFNFRWTEDQLILESIRQPERFEMIETSQGITHSYWASEAVKTIYSISN
jgi:hypothetical protein